MQLIAPYVVVAGVIFGIFSIAKGTPFYRDKHKQSLQTMKEFDNYVHIRNEQQYAGYDGKNTDYLKSSSLTKKVN